MGVIFDEHSNFLEILYISDVDTCKVLLANNAVADALGENQVGQKCCRGFQQLEEPCVFCTNQFIQKPDGKPHVWGFHHPALEQVYFISDQGTYEREIRPQITTPIIEQKQQEEIPQKYVPELNQNNEYLTRFNRMAMGSEHRMTSPPLHRDIPVICTVCRD